MSDWDRTAIASGISFVCFSVSIVVGYGQVRHGTFAGSEP